MERQKIVASDRDRFDSFGADCSISGDYALVGAPFEDDNTVGQDSINEAGSAYLFKRDASGNWVEQQKFVSSRRKEQALFGNKVYIEGDYAVVAASDEDTMVSGSPTLYNAARAVYIFERDNTGQWSFHQRLNAPVPSLFAEFGSDVQIEGNRMLVGAQGDDYQASSSLLSSGTAYLYERNMNTGQWELVQALFPSIRTTSQKFGYSVALSGNRAIVGVTEDYLDENGQDSIRSAGAVFIFEEDASGNWNQVQKLVASDRGFQYEFVNAVSISNDYIAVAAWEKDSLNGNLQPIANAGGAYMFEYNGTNWQEVSSIGGVPPRSENTFGSQLSLQGDQVFVSASSDPYDANNTDSLEEAGTLYIFERTPLTRSEIAAQDGFDASVFPNPVKGVMHLCIRSEVSNAKLQLRIYDYLGRVLHKSEERLQGNSFIAIPAVTDLPAGQYYLELQYQSEQHSLPFVKQ